MIGKNISHYRILEKLGEGGMGVVYKAEDTKLKRTVALKFLPPHLTKDEEAKTRFITEAQAASALDHQNICTIFDIKQTDDEQLYIVMAYYEGETLQEQVARGEGQVASGRSRSSGSGSGRSGGIEITEAIDIAGQIAAGLARAHEAGITHRDIKPSNIMITERSEVKILDFGIARIAGQKAMTKTGSTLGTVAYMSPEQVKGEPVDNRTDTWSLGVVLYEMLAGRRPFDAEYDQAVMYSIVNQPHEPVFPTASGREDVPEALGQIVDKALAKKADERYQRADEMMDDLRSDSQPAAAKRPISKTPTTRKATPAFLWPALIFSAIVLAVAGYFFLGKEAESSERIPIAVADFVNQTGEAELDGLSEMLVTSLEQSRRLAVLPRASMYGMLTHLGKDSITIFDEQLVREICAQADVNTMATASIRKLGQVYAIDLKILDLEQNKYLLTLNERADGQENIFPMLDRLSEKIRLGLQETQANIAAKSRAIAEVTTTNMQAYQHYFQGLQKMYAQANNPSAAQPEFEKAIALDSTFGLAYVRLASLFAESNVLFDKEYIIRKALTLVDRIPEKERYLLRAMAAFFEDGEKAGIRILKEMEKDYPDDKDMIFLLGTRTSNDSMAAHYLEKSLELDPANNLARRHLYEAYRSLQDFEKMRTLSEQTIATRGYGYSWLAETYALSDNFRAGVERLKKAQKLFPENNEIPFSLARLFELNDQFEEAEKTYSTYIDVDQPPASSFWGLSPKTLFTYRGQYRKLLAFADRHVAWSREDNTIDAANAAGVKVMVQLLAWGDKETARREFELSAQIGQVDARHVVYYLIMLGEYEEAERFAAKYFRMEEDMKILMHIQKGECKKAVALSGRVQNLSTQDRGSEFAYLYGLSSCFLELGQTEEAIAALRQLQVKYSYYFPDRARAFFYPKSFYTLGKIYERQGDAQRAIENTEKFLDLWKNADADLPDLIDAKARVARLKGE